MEISYYNNLAEDYNLKRQKPWKALEEFLHYIDMNRLSPSSNCLDIGCGNGRNFPLLSLVSNHIIGLDNSLDLLKLAKKNEDVQLKKFSDKNVYIQLILCCLDSIPIRPNIIDSAFIIAVIHHIKGKNKRKIIMEQIYELIKESGWLIVSVWRKYQKKYRWDFIKDLIKRTLLPKYAKFQHKAGLGEFGDKIVPWTVSKEDKTYPRFYHFFSYQEAMSLMKDFKIVEMSKLGGPGKKDNFFFLLKK